MVVTTMPDHICNILLEGSSDMRLNKNRNLFELVFDFIKETGRFMVHNDDVATNVNIVP